MSDEATDPEPEEETPEEEAGEETPDASGDE